VDFTGNVGAVWDTRRIARGRQVPRFFKMPAVACEIAFFSADGHL